MRPRATHRGPTPTARASRQTARVPLVAKPECPRSAERRSYLAGGAITPQSAMGRSKRGIPLLARRTKRGAVAVIYPRIASVTSTRLPAPETEPRPRRSPHIKQLTFIIKAMNSHRVNRFPRCLGPRRCEDVWRGEGLPRRAKDATPCSLSRVARTRPAAEPAGFAQDSLRARWTWGRGQSRPSLTSRMLTMSTLYVRDGDDYRQAVDSEVFARANALISQRYRAGAPVLKSPERLREYLRLHLGSCEHEVFGIVHVDSRHRLIAVQDLFRGTVDTASVHPREVVKAVISHNAAAVFLFHNHPSGASDPSANDQVVTKRIQNALAFVDVNVLDHFIVGEPIYSFAENGLI
jgi:DNA repair protein RadC